MRKVFVIVIACFALLSVACKNEDSPSDASAKVAGVVKYEVTSNPAGFQVVYKDSTGTTVQKTISATTWTVSFTGHQADSVSVSAKATNANATISTKIYYEGNVLGQGSASGDYSTAKAFGKL